MSTGYEGVVSRVRRAIRGAAQATSFIGRYEITDSEIDAAAANIAEAEVVPLVDLLRESQDSIGGDWRARRDAALDRVRAE